ncbi:MAG TPA: cobalamin-independent methionine synthase II family protein [Baekduia sp.]|nr:cobalamin-independent methionine synthase II family protein [Baekduia sp.]
MTIIKTSRTPRSPARAESIGSLIRSSAITDHINRMYEDETTAWRSLIIDDRPLEVAELNALADAAIVDQVQRQIDAGLDVVTDGEQRRTIFMSSFYDGIAGVVAAEQRLPMGDGTMLSDPVIKDRITKAASPAAEEATFMRAITDFPFKITIPTPSYYFTDFSHIESSAYKDKFEFVEDVTRVTKEIVADAIAAGARWIQFDFPVYPALVATQTPLGSSLIESVGDQADRLLDKALEFDAAVTADIPDGVTTALHLCRGNIPGGFWDGSLAPIAERMFNELPHDRFLLEWEDVNREGGYEPIKHVPKDRILAMGVVSTKTPELESEDEILERIDEASKHLDVSQLAISPQCGFASGFADHLVSAEDVQWRKLELIGRVADRVWGSA